MQLVKTFTLCYSSYAVANQEESKEMNNSISWDDTGKDR